MSNLLEMTHPGQHGQYCLEEHPVVPFTALAELEISGIPLGGMELGITEHEHLAFKLLDQILEVAVMHIRGVAIPSNDPAMLIDQQAQLASDDPAMVRFTFLANLVRASSSRTG